MGRILAVVIGLGAVAYGAYYALRGSIGSGGTEKSAPKETMDRMHDKAKEIEQDTQRRADEMMKKTTPE